MKPQEPVTDKDTLYRTLVLEALPFDDFEEVTYAKNQAPYISLPVIREKSGYGQAISRWRLSWRERLCVLIVGDLYLSQLTFGQPLQPIKPTTTFEESLHRTEPEEPTDD